MLKFLVLLLAIMSPAALACEPIHFDDLKLKLVFEKVPDQRFHYTAEVQEKRLFGKTYRFLPQGGYFTSCPTKSTLEPGTILEVNGHNVIYKVYIPGQGRVLNHLNMADLSQVRVWPKHSLPRFFQNPHRFLFLPDGKLHFLGLIRENERDDLKSTHYLYDLESGRLKTTGVQPAFQNVYPLESESGYRFMFIEGDHDQQMGWAHWDIQSEKVTRFAEFGLMQQGAADFFGSQRVVYVKDGGSDKHGPVFVANLETGRVESLNLTVYQSRPCQYAQGSLAKLLCKESRFFYPLTLACDHEQGRYFIFRKFSKERGLSAWIYDYSTKQARQVIPYKKRLITEADLKAHCPSSP